MMARTGMHSDGRHSTRPRLRYVNAFTRWILHAPVLRRLADHQVCELQLAGMRSGRRVALPVMYAQRGEQVVVLVGGPDGKRWWRTFTRPHPVRVLLRGVTRTGIGHVVASDAAGRAGAAEVMPPDFPTFRWRMTQWWSSRSIR
jgi:hypothetical protein